MSVPSVSISKIDFQTGSVGPSPDGVLAIISPAATGSLNAPAGYSRDDLALKDFGPSRLVEAGSYTLATAGNPVVLVRSTGAVAASYGAIDVTGMTGTSVVTAGATAPADNYDALVTWIKGGAIGAAGLQYQYSLDGGNTTSGPQSLPTGAAPITLMIPNFSAGGSPGVSFSLGAGSVNPGDFFSCLTAPAKMNDGDLVASLEALRVTTLPFEGVLIDEEAGTGTTGLVDTWLAALEKVGRFKFAVLNTRLKNQLDVGSGAVETETAYATAMTTLTGQAAPSIRLCLGTDGALVASTITGLLQPRPTSLLLAARAMAIPIGEDPAFVGAGPLGDVIIVDGQGNPAFHNEELYPNLDQLLLTALRSVEGQKGVYINNARVFSVVGSDYVFLPQIRTMNRALEIAFKIMTLQLGRGVGKKPKDPVTGAVYIQEADALTIEGLINTAQDAPLKNAVQAHKFTLSRTDDIGANSGAILSGSQAIVSLAYIKGFRVLAAFARSISVAA